MIKEYLSYCLSYCFCRVRVLKANKMCILGKPVNYYHNYNLSIWFRRVSMKSIVMLVKITLGMGSGCNVSGFATDSYLFFWQTTQFLTYYLTILDKPFQYTIEESLFLFAETLEFPPKAELWYSCKNFCFNSVEFPITNLPLLLNRSSVQEYCGWDCRSCYNSWIILWIEELVCQDPLIATVDLFTDPNWF